MTDEKQHKKPGSWLKLLACLIVLGGIAAFIGFAAPPPPWANDEIDGSAIFYSDVTDIGEFMTDGKYSFQVKAENQARKGERE